MKIGEFAKKHQVTVDTVRHYMAEGLLTPLKENTQYVFSEIDDEVMDNILLLKSMNFKLDEMRAYLLFQTMFSANSLSGSGSFAPRFQEKLAQNRAEIKRLEEMNRLIEGRLQGAEKTFSFKRGVALSLIGSLRCPDCRKPLEVEKPELLHNEIMKGELLCPDCGRRYYMRGGIVADRPLPDTPMKQNIGEISGMIEDYVRKNDESYVMNIRELYQKCAEMAEKNCRDAENILISGESSSFLVSAILRSMPRQARLFVHIEHDDTIIKYFQEDLFPPETLIYSGDIEKAPFQEPMDYIFWQDYDGVYLGRKLKLYPHVRAQARLDCAKALVFQRDLDYPDEKRFFADLKKLGWENDSAVKTKRIVRARESTDMNIIEREGELEVQFGIYSFKTLG